MLHQSFWLRVFPVAILCSVLVAVGCGQQRQTGTVAVSAPPAKHVGEPLTKEDYEAFGKKLEKAVMAQDSNSITLCYSAEKMFENAISDLNLSDTDRKVLLSGGAEGVSSLAGSLTQTIKGGGNFKFVRIKQTDDKWSVLCRLITPRGASNYQEFILVRFPNGIIAAEDVYMHSTGDMFSQTIRRNVLALLAEKQKKSAGTFKDSDQRVLDNIERFLELKKAAQEGNNVRALAAYNGMTPEFRDQKEVLLNMITASTKNDLAQARKSIERFRELYPKNLALDFVLLGYHTSKGEFDKVIECYSRLIDAIGGDSVLHYRRAQVLLRENRQKEAKEDLQEAVLQEPTLTNAYPALIDLVVQEKDHPATLKWLKQGIENKAFNPDENFFRTTEIYQDFVKSKEFPEMVRWLNARKK